MKPHARFERDEDDLIFRERITFPQAALGCTLSVPTIDGAKSKIKIPAGVQHGAVFRVQGKGMPKLRGRGYGDLLVGIQVEVPKNLSAPQRALLEEFAKTLEGPRDIPGYEEEPPKEPQDPQAEGGLFKKIFGG
ncbi:MAG: DnaJ C-terminal domain-containing protein, partial [Elusimicrobiota bacterium]